MSISLEWVKNISSPKERTDFEFVLRNSTMIVERLSQLCDEWEEDLNRKETRDSDFDTPNWAVKQAYRNGDRSRIRKLRDLLSFINKKAN